MLSKETIYVNKDKCIFNMNNVIFLDFVVSSKGFKYMKKGIKVIKDWSTLTDVSKVRYFHWLPIAKVVYFDDILHILRIGMIM